MKAYLTKVEKLRQDIGKSEAKLGSQLDWNRPKERKHVTCSSFRPI